MHIVRLTDDLPADIATLVPFATAEGVGIVDTLRAEWASGDHRFTGPGEVLLSARVDDDLAGVGGITRDLVVREALRMRRFYVHPAFRRQGVGRALAEWLIDHARAHTDRLTVYAGTESGRRFWERMGFTPVASDTRTHEMKL